MHDTYTHTETCTQSFKDHLRAHIVSRKESLSSGATFTNSGVVVSTASNPSSAETLKPVEAPLCVCGSPAKDGPERFYTGEVQKVAGCDCARRVTVIEGPGGEDSRRPEAKKSFGSKALDLLCSACTGYVAKPKAGGFYPNEE